ncbi:MAG: hypothetical protein HY532_02995 [Chloroflexi bacterium]|nr:hypothetical protein [Chloroflexota bacterium]
MTTLAQAIQQEQWELAALLLVQGVLEAAQRIPEDALLQLLESWMTRAVRMTRETAMAEKIKPTHFYAQALSEAERLLLPDARSVDGLDDEIALLRVRLFTAVQEHPDNFVLLVMGINSLVRLAALRHKLSPASAEKLSEHLAGIIREVGGALYPEHFNNA